MARYLPDGNLDASFGGDGIATTSFRAIGFDRALCNAVALQTDGKIVAAGVFDDVTTVGFALARFLPDGSLDATFSGDGMLTIDAGAPEVRAILIQPDGKIVAVGGIALARFHPDGALDTTFGTAGVVSVRPDFEQAGAVLQPDGKIVTAGDFDSEGGQRDFAVARFLSDGSFDTTFGGGLVTTSFGRDSSAGPVALQPDGKIIAAGSDLVRYLPNGALDTTFDGDGRVTTDLGSSGGVGSDVILQPDGKIVAAGFFSDDFALARYLSDGALDATFGDDGLVTTNFGANVVARVRGLIMQPNDGRLVAVGTAFLDTAAGGERFDFALARYHSGLVPAEITTYRLTRIGGDELFQLTVHDMNENGEMVGAAQIVPGGAFRAILLRNGTVTELGDLIGGASTHVEASAINDLTQVTGLNQIPDGSGNLDAHGFLWEGGQIRDLGVNPDAIPQDINNRGQIVGGSRGADNVGRPFLWEAGRTTFLEVLACPGDLGGSAIAINNNSVIVGTSNFPAGRRAVIWRDGGTGGIMPLEPPFVLELGQAVDVNDRGDVIGVYSRSFDPEMRMGTPLLWQADEVTVLPLIDHPEAEGAIPQSINDQRQIVGSTHVGSGRHLATLWQGSAALDLNGLVSDDDPAKGFVTLVFAAKITDSGLIVAAGTDSREPEPRDTVYYLLRPTGAPALSAAVPSPSASSPPPSDNGGGAVDRVLLLLLVMVMSASAACVRRRQRALAARPFD